MDCQEFRKRLDLYVADELPPEAADEMRGHLEGCAACAKEEAGLRHLRSSLKRVVNRHRPPPALETQLLQSLRSDKSAGGRRAVDESLGDGTPFWHARVVVPVPLFALLLLAVVALVGWLVFARGPAREEVSNGRPVPLSTPAPPGEASGGFDFTRYYRGERASIQVVRRESTEGSRQ